MNVKAKITWTATETDGEFRTEVLAEGTGPDILAGFKQIFDEITKSISKELGVPVNQIRTILLEALKKEGQK